ncbi:hypothetical protein ACPCUV_26745 [Streptomyces platensis]|uniref:hypothetical protein n=1 Tax=Streptomyces platensis TaxID=58346 RepID=UPI003C30ABA3
MLIGTLQLEVDVESRDVLFAWGYFPNVRGSAAELGAPNCFPGRVSISSVHSFHSGVSLEVPGKGWRVAHDPSSGWVAIRLKDSDDADFVQIASGIVLGIDTGNLVSVWLDPVFQGDRR